MNNKICCWNEETSLCISQVLRNLWPSATCYTVGQIQFFQTFGMTGQYPSSHLYFSAVRQKVQVNPFIRCSDTAQIPGHDSFQIFPFYFQILQALTHDCFPVTGKSSPKNVKFINLPRLPDSFHVHVTPKFHFLFLILCLNSYYCKWNWQPDKSGKSSRLVEIKPMKGRNEHVSGVHVKVRRPGISASKRGLWGGGTSVLNTGVQFLDNPSLCALQRI